MLRLVKRRPKLTAQFYLEFRHDSPDLRAISFQITFNILSRV